VSALKQAIVGDQGVGEITPTQPHGEGADVMGATVLTLPTAAVAVPTTTRKRLLGGVYPAAVALSMMNSHYVVGRTGQETAIYRRTEGGLLVFVPDRQFKLEVANIFVKPPSGSGKPISVEKFWKEHPQRCELELVFKPGGTIEPGEINQWLGFGIVPRKTRRKIWSLLRHIWKVICRCNKAKFKDVIRWLAWAVQNPDKPAGVVLVLVSRKEGTGKTTVGLLMVEIFGRHGALVDDKDRLLGRFNDWLEFTCFVLAEEVLWAGDHRTADKLKSLITAETIQVERKHGACRQVKNRLHMIMTTNHEFAVPAGVEDRRYFVLDVSDEHARDDAWFGRLYRDLDDGGREEFLDFLQTVRLGTWHPREILKTTETAEQQRMSGDSVSQWSQACINADALVDGSNGVGCFPLGQRISTKILRGTYASYCKQYGLRPSNEELFGKACTQMFGARVRLAPDNMQRRPWGYDVPAGDQWQEKLDARLGIQ
jgi:Family of unknown function (DUF5906)